MLTQNQKDALEKLVDSSSVVEVLSALSEILEEKAQHIEESWQDVPLASAWNRAGLKLYRCINAMPLVPGIRSR